jgi:hypothetical protein
MKGYFYEYLRGRWVEIPIGSVASKKVVGTIGPLEPGFMLRHAKEGKISILDSSGSPILQALPGSRIGLSSGESRVLWTNEPAGISKGETVPVKVYDGHFSIEVSVGGVPLQFVIDSGSEATLIDPAALKKVHGFKSRDPLVTYPKERCVTLPSFKIGGLRLADVVAVVRRAKGMQSPRSRQIAGVLGYGALRTLALGFDFRNLQLTVWDRPKPWEAEKNFFGKLDDPVYTPLREVPLVYDDGSPIPNLYSAQIDLRAGDAVRPIMIDTGAPIAGLPPDFPNAKQWKSLGNFDSMSLEAPENDVLRVADSLRICDLTILTTAVKESTDFGDDGLGGIFGWAQFCPFGKALLDFSNRWLGIEGDVKTASGLTASLFDYGIRPVDGQLIAASGWPASQAGIAKSNKIESLNGVDVHRLKKPDTLTVADLKSLYLNSNAYLSIAFEAKGRQWSVLIQDPNGYSVKASHSGALKFGDSGDVIVSKLDSDQKIRVRRGEKKAVPSGAIFLSDHAYSIDELPTGQWQVTNPPPAEPTQKPAKGLRWMYIVGLGWLQVRLEN